MRDGTLLGKAHLPCLVHGPSGRSCQYFLFSLAISFQQVAPDTRLPQLPRTRRCTGEFRGCGVLFGVDPVDEARHEFGIDLERASVSEASKLIDVNADAVLNKLQRNYKSYCLQLV